MSLKVRLYPAANCYFNTFCAVCDVRSTRYNHLSAWIFISTAHTAEKQLDHRTI